MSCCIVQLVMKMNLRIRDLREDSDLTQLPLIYAVKLARFYKTSVDYLVGLTKEKKPYRP